MRIKQRVSLPWLAVAFLAVALPATPSAWAVSNGGAAATLLSSDLPAGLTLKKASVEQVGDALYTAATQKPDMVLGLLEVAIVSKRPRDREELPCPDLRILLHKAMAAVPDKSRELLELALTLDPGCTDSLNAQLDEAFEKVYGFGAGLGSNFPGSPGFTGSAPGGATALPPATNPQTTSVTGG
jgi:hypothetical protein